MRMLLDQSRPYQHSPNDSRQPDDSVFHNCTKLILARILVSETRPARRESIHITLLSPYTSPIPHHPPETLNKPLMSAFSYRQWAHYLFDHTMVTITGAWPPAPYLPPLSSVDSIFLTQSFTAALPTRVSPIPNTVSLCVTR